MPRKILIGWSAIADYLGCSLSSAQRREEDGLPVFRVGGSVRAHTADIDEWIKESSRRPRPTGNAVDSGFPGFPGTLDLNGIVSAFTVERDGKRYAVVPVGSSDAEVQKVIAQISETAERLQTILEKAPAWIWETDASGKFRYTNREVFHILGYKPEEIVGRTTIELGMVKEDVPRFAKCVKALKRDGTRINRLVCRFSRGNGDIRDLQTIAEAAYDDDGNFTGIRGVTFDVTDAN
jgi:PAS domain S-box-containing protein